jgi:hypothetical protein
MTVAAVVIILAAFVVIVATLERRPHIDAVDRDAVRRLVERLEHERQINPDRES